MSHASSPILAPAVDLPAWAEQSINLASLRLNAKALYATDDFFAPIERMLNPDPAIFIPDKYDDHGKWMDGWETRRKRTSGHDWGIVKLGCSGHIVGFDLDTSHFTGNYAPAISIDALRSDDDDLDHLKQADWIKMLPSISLEGHRHHFVALSEALQEKIWSHIRVNIYPDGGIARLRVYGHPVLINKPDDKRLIDLVAMEHGGRAIAWNDAHYGVPHNIILPGQGINMGDGWETRRRREPGSDWCILQLGQPGIVKQVDIDTSFFKGNYPDRFSIQAACIEAGTNQSIISQSMFWQELLPEQKLDMDQIFTYREELVSLGKITHVRLNIIPDGGISRLRLWGTC